MMPFYEQGNLHSQLQVSKVSLMGYLSVPDPTGQRLALLMQDIPTLLCPSDSGGDAAKTARDFRTGIGTGLGGHPAQWKPGLNNYISNRGMRSNRQLTQDTHGMFMENRAIKIGEVTSNTVLFGERESQTGRAGVWPGVRTPNGSGARGIDATTGHFRAPMNSQDPPVVWTDNARGAGSGFSSLHVGGAQFVFADGSVHFISETVDWREDRATAPNVASENDLDIRVYGVYQRLGRRNDGFVLGEF
jgi:prepilin-type processing-associated H-X9-DG protein